MHAGAEKGVGANVRGWLFAAAIRGKVAVAGGRAAEPSSPRRGWACS